MKTRLLLILAALIGLCAMSMPIFKHRTHTTTQPSQTVNQNSIADNQPRNSEMK